MLRLLTAALALFATAAAAEDACHPEVDTTKSQYIIGYGSLMETASKERSSPTAGPNRPVRVTGYQRAWNTRGGLVGFSTTYLGVQKAEGVEMNAALYLDVNTSDITGTDLREEFYCRDAVAAEAVEVLDGEPLLADAQIWIYYNKPDAVHPPTPRWPIVQSYVDIFLTGCLELEKKVVADRLTNSTFSEECILTTEGWSEHWVNDRLYPRRAFIYQPNASRIDRLIHKMLPDEFDAIRIE